MTEMARSAAIEMTNEREGGEADDIRPTKMFGGNRQRQKAGKDGRWRSGTTEIGGGGDRDRRGGLQVSLGATTERD